MVNVTYCLMKYPENYETTTIIDAYIISLNATTSLKLHWSRASSNFYQSSLLANRKKRLRANGTVGHHLKRLEW
jgi:hypothetical protein